MEQFRATQRYDSSDRGEEERLAPKPSLVQIDRWNSKKRGGKYYYDYAVTVHGNIVLRAQSPATTLDSLKEVES